MDEPPDSPSADLPIGALLERMAETGPGPHGGSAAAFTAAMAASLVVLAARLAPAPAEADAVAERLRTRLTELADEDVEAYAAYLEARAAGDDAAVGAALVRAAEVPLEIAETAATLTGLAAELTHDGHADARGDAVAAALLAEAAARAAANLVAVNLSVKRDDRRLARAKAAVAEATAAAERAWRAARRMP